MNTLLTGTQKEDIGQHGSTPAEPPSLNMASRIQKLAIIGAGQMGGGIAQVAAAIAKIPSVYLFDVQKAQLDTRMSFIGITTQSAP